MTYNGVVMVEDAGKEYEPKVEFDSAGEAIAYISLDQARVLALQHARDNQDFYGASYAGVNLVWEVMSAEESEDYYDVRLFFRPAGRYRSEPGVEQLIFDKTGDLRVRQMLDEPSELDESSSTARQVDEALRLKPEWGAPSDARAFALVLWENQLRGHAPEQ